MLRNILKLWSFIPMIAVMYMIWSFSAQEGADSSSLSLKAGLRLVRIVDSLADLELEEARMVYYADRLQPLVRKGAHVAEYFLLALTTTLPVYVYGFGGLWPFIVAALVCFSFAGLDEFHQSFVAGRSSSRTDVLIDSAGALCGILISRIFRMRKRRR